MPADARESEPLIGGGDGSKPVLNENTPESRRLWWNFMLMCIFFSLNHGCVVSCLAYASSVLGDTLGAYGSGALYICYSLTALLVAKPVVAMVGPQRGLFIGVTGYCIYVGGFLFAAVVDALAWPVFILACIVGGTAGGILWPSQGRYFTKNAKLYSESSGIPVDKVNATFAGFFAASYLGFEMITKLSATILYLLYPDSALYAVFSLYTVIALVSCFMVAGLDDLDELGTREFNYETAKNQLWSVGQLVISDVRLALMIPFQVAFGFASSFIPYYVLGTVVSDYIGTTYVGLLSALIVLAGASTAVPSAYLANAIGKPFVMTVGGSCMAFAGFAFYFFTDAQLGTWSMIIVYLIIYGLGRGTWENTNKAVIADLFTEAPENSVSAFAAVSFSNGFAGAIGYFTDTSLSRVGMATMVSATSTIAIVCYWIMVGIHQKYLDEASTTARMAKYEA